MKTIELAKQLAKALAESAEYQNYKAAKEKVEAHEAARTMLKDFREKQIELERKRMNGDKLLQPLEEELRKLTEIISLNPFVRDYLIAEFQFSMMIMDVQKIIGEAVGLEVPGSESIRETLTEK